MKFSVAALSAFLPLLAHAYAPIVKPDGSVAWDTTPKQPYTGDRSIPHYNSDGSITWSSGEDPPAANSPAAPAAPPPSPKPTPAPAAPQHAQQPQQPQQPQKPQQPKAEAPKNQEQPTQAAQPDPPNKPTETPAFKPGEPVQNAPLDPTPAPPPPGGCAAEGKGVMTWRVSNNYGVPLSVSYLNNADSPSAIGCPGAAQMAPSATTDIVFPTGWAGRMIIGKQANSGASLIEGSTTGWNDVDVSFVDGFSVPITCSNDKEVLTGCNIDLWKTGQTCPNRLGDICLNPAVSSPNGPATPFFLPCQGAAYTFPNDNIANSGNTQSKLVTCCIGTQEQGCQAPTRQGHGNNQPSKRDVGADVLKFSARHRHMMRHVRSIKNLN